MPNATARMSDLLLQEALTFISQHFRLNAFKEVAEHQAPPKKMKPHLPPPWQAWADVEGNLHRAVCSYCLQRFQRNQGSRQTPFSTPILKGSMFGPVRPGHGRMEMIKEVIKLSLEARTVDNAIGRKNMFVGSLD